MTKKEIFDRLNEVFSDVFDDDSIKLEDKTTSDDIEDWDSLEHIRLIAAVEQAFKVRFSMGEVVGMKNVGEMVSLILEKKR